MQVNGQNSGAAPRKTPRLYVRQEDRYEDLSSSASAFLIVGIVMTVLSLLSFGRQLHLPFALPATALMRFFLLVFAFGAFGLFLKTRREASRAYSHIEEEQRITEELENWFLANYAPEQIDLEILGTTRRPLRAEALALKRFDFIQDCFLQRYDGMDEGYIEALSEELYKKLFESGHYGKAVLRKAGNHDKAVGSDQTTENTIARLVPEETLPAATAPQESIAEATQPVETAPDSEAETAFGAETPSAVGTATKEAAADSAETEPSAQTGKQEYAAR